jgi:hypothetical protein
VLPGTEVPERGAHGFILVRDGTEPVAVTDSHGTWLEWLGERKTTRPAGPPGAGSLA